MLPSQTIVAIASDPALLRSLAFALGVEGFDVETYDSWQAAQLSASRALCTIIDAEICRRDPRARQSLLDPANKFVLLADGMWPCLDHANIHVLTKPLRGTDVLETVNAFRNAAR